MGVQVVDGAFDGGHGLLHAAHGAFAARSNHVVAIGGGAVADDFGVDLGTTRLCVFQLLDHHHAAAAGDDETVTLGVVGAGGLFRGVVVLGGQGAHGIEQHGLAPVLLFTTTGEDNILLAQLDLLHGAADAMGTGGAGGGDGVVDALDLERGSQTGGNGAAHGARHAVWPDLLHAFLTQNVDGLHLVQRGGATAAGDQAGARVADLFFGQASVGDRLLHGQVGKGRGIAHEALDLAVDSGVQVDLHAAGDMAAQAHFCVFGVVGNA